MGTITLVFVKMVTMVMDGPAPPFQVRGFIYSLGATETPIIEPTDINTGIFYNIIQSNRDFKICNSNLR